MTLKFSLEISQPRIDHPVNYLWRRQLLWCLQPLGDTATMLLTLVILTSVCVVSLKGFLVHLENQGLWTLRLRLSLMYEYVLLPYFLIMYPALNSICWEKFPLTSIRCSKSLDKICWILPEDILQHQIMWQ